MWGEWNMDNELGKKRERLERDDCMVLLLGLILAASTLAGPASHRSLARWLAGALHSPNSVIRAVRMRQHCKSGTAGLAQREERGRNAGTTTTRVRLCLD